MSTRASKALTQISYDVWNSRIECDPSKAVMAGVEVKKLPQVS